MGRAQVRAMSVAAAETAGRGLERFADVAALIAARAPRLPVYALHPKRFRAAAQEFLTGFPGTTLYAVKANPAPEVVDQIHAAGIRHFDTASLPEVAFVRARYGDVACHFMSPVRIAGWAAEAYRRHHVRHFVVDCDAELDKLLAETGGGGDLTIYARLATPVAGALLELSSKFGAGPAETAALLKRIAAAGAKPALTFHVGSQCLRPDAYAKALTLCRRVIEASGVRLAALDIGGGFPARYAGNRVPPLEKFFTAIGEARGALGLPDDCEILCEPGRALVADGVSLVTQVILRKGDRLYINDGVYGSLDETTLPGWTAEHPRRVFTRRAGGEIGLRRAKNRPFKVFGPTCDTLDVLPRPLALPETVAAGDWIVFDRIGAYSCALRTQFNGFYPDEFVVTDEA